MSDLFWVIGQCVIGQCVSLYFLSLTAQNVILVSNTRQTGLCSVCMCVNTHTHLGMFSLEAKQLKIEQHVPIAESWTVYTLLDTWCGFLPVPEGSPCLKNN